LRPVRIVALAAALSLPVASASAHFQEILPSTDNFGEGDTELALDLVFTHPMDRGPTMEMAKPVRFGVVTGAGETDLLDTLVESPRDGKMAWKANYKPAGPGTYTFFVEPKPYWEPAEGKSIIHYSKVVVDAFGWGAD